MFLVRLPLSLFIYAADKIAGRFPFLVDSIAVACSSRLSPYVRLKILRLYTLEFVALLRLHGKKHQLGALNSIQASNQAVNFAIPYR